MRSLGWEVSKPSVELDDSSRSFFVCSCSILADNVWMRCMNSLNWLMFSNGPRLKLHNKGSTSTAKKSESTILPTCLNTARAAIITAGSLVLIAFSEGTIFSCIVNLSNTAVLFRLDEGSFRAPSSPSPRSSGSPLDGPPHRITKASKPRTLIPKLAVLLKTAATTGKTSCLMVEKSKMSRIVGRQPRDLSTKE